MKKIIISASRAPIAAKSSRFTRVALLNRLLAGEITPADDEVSVEVLAGEAGDLHRHLFKRADGKQALFVYDKGADSTVAVKLQTPGATAWKFNLDGSSAEYPAFDGRALGPIHLKAGSVVIFAIEP